MISTGSGCGAAEVHEVATRREDEVITLPVAGEGEGDGEVGKDIAL